MCSGSEPELGSSCGPVIAAGATPTRPGAILTTRAVYAGTSGLQAYRQASAETCAISALDDPRSFRAQCRVDHLGSCVLADVRSSSLRYFRSARHVARGAYDHYQVTFNLSGQIHYQSGRQSAIARPDDVVVLDSARETDAFTHAPDHGSAHALTLFVPRAALPPLRRAPQGGHLLLLDREDTLARSAHDHLSKVLETIEREAQIQAAVQALIGLLAGSLGGRRPLAPAGWRPARRLTADSLERLIERRLDSPALSLGLLCSYCGCSRATVYRLLEADGGPIRYIRQRRLHRAFQELISGSVSRGRILELALRHRFASEATFNRAFRRTFGIPPGEVRELAARSRRSALAGGAAAIWGASDGAEAINWIRTLTDPGG
jgi:AraC-like DNA-binding protein